ncbi:hypothetical protein VNO77_05890 [Canavalia gladiata]|uniref:Uncharacterized protein n=1 Tax=Canavalia gladiata TaxID=3824 RepID=A0AAN9MZX6_CANGL
MGNCCKPASPMEWGGDDWSSLTSKNTSTRKTSSSKVFDESHGQGLSLGNVQKEKLLGALRASSPRHANGKVKIKISKKELIELLGGIEKQQQAKKHVGRRASAEQVLFRLMNARDHDAHNHTLWRPVLDSIPEVD